MHDRFDPASLREPGPPAARLLTTIRKAHERSEMFGLSASVRPDYDILTDAALALKREQNRILCAHAMPVMETLHDQIANTHSMIVLTNAEGLILHSIGDDDFLQRAKRVALMPGANWAENRQGTNGIGTALAERSALVVHGEQHYLSANHFLTCSSVPILDPYGQVAGVLDVTGDHRSYHQHTMALAKMSVQMIENYLFASTFQEMLQVSFHGRAEFLGTLMEGIVAFSEDGHVASANRSAQFQLGMSLPALRAQTLASLFQTTWTQLLDWRRANREVPLMLNLSNGAVVCARVQSRPAARADALHRGHARALAEAADAAGPGRPAAARRASRLAELDTGDPRMAGVIAKLRKVIGKDIPVLVTGPTGSGKELLAQAIHADSPRGDGPFVAVNCASIPETLIESELFGYEAGAFTGARRGGAVGKLMQADGGTLFLDEIGDMPYPLQARLLRVLQERQVNPLGSARSIPIDVAIVCATHRDLREMLARHQFREDLYYRLNGLTVRLPALRERKDLRVVVARMLEQEARASGRARALRVAPEVMVLFERCAWPGNFRQLGNLLRTAAAMADDDEPIRAEHLPDDFLEELRRDDRPEPAGREGGPARAGEAGAVRLQDVAASVVVATLARHGGNVSAAARELGVSRNTIYRKIQPEDSLPGTVDGGP
ncbi:sigma-54-dependent Fis family transcriptional regulator [Burkholderia gladioli]|uniref:sigma-54-dependent Fis family transcriptional regulator n=1 Tax=Burkholderia gladioli TaxID=28095 RepID=UPI00163E1DE0|nr:sigma-54-dependent Fis family transcriptional regulator [Burkholderia gladioli]MBU9641447.1 sigma-54-dependent Fis family transcriptional regulator [Burkholderia gladioli]